MATATLEGYMELTATWTIFTNSANEEGHGKWQIACNLPLMATNPK